MPGRSLTSRRTSSHRRELRFEPGAAPSPDRHDARASRLGRGSELLRCRRAIGVRGRRGLRTRLSLGVSPPPERSPSPRVAPYRPESGLGRRSGRGAGRPARAPGTSRGTAWAHPDARRPAVRRSGTDRERHVLSPTVGKGLPSRIEVNNLGGQTFAQAARTQVPNRCASRGAFIG
jgi:hypothetical protein